MTLTPMVSGVQVGRRSPQKVALAQGDSAHDLHWVSEFSLSLSLLVDVAAVF
jgi:hypothetical protein